MVLRTTSKRKPKNSAVTAANQTTAKPPFTRLPSTSSNSRFIYLPYEITFIILDLVSYADLYALCCASAKILQFIPQLFKRRNREHYQADLLLWSAYYGIFNVMKDVLDTGFNPNITL